jgi:pimeloyl-ACP methyl ester carboxylesterase
MSAFVFIHGSGCTGDVFAAQTAAFPGSYAIDLPGHRSPALAGEITIAAFADAVERDLEARDVEGAILCGSSMGGAVALEAALRGNPRIGAIVMLGSGAKLRVAPALFESLERDFEAGARALVPIFFAEPTPERVEAAAAEMLRVGQAQTLADFRACDAFDATERLAGLAVPLLALTGEHDRLTPPKFAAFLADRIPGAEARILPQAGHLAMVERPEETNAVLRAFVDRLTR